MTRAEALNVVINLLDNYLTGSPDTLPEYSDISAATVWRSKGNKTVYEGIKMVFK